MIPEAGTLGWTPYCRSGLRLSTCLVLFSDCSLGSCYNWQQDRCMWLYTSQVYCWVSGWSQTTRQVSTDQRKLGTLGSYVPVAWSMYHWGIDGFALSLISWIRVERESSLGQTYPTIHFDCVNSYWWDVGSDSSWCIVKCSFSCNHKNTCLFWALRLELPLLFVESALSQWRCESPEWSIAKNQGKKRVIYPLSLPWYGIWSALMRVSHR
jgi:hypothetical protein